MPILPLLQLVTRESIKTCMVPMNQNPNLIRFCKNDYYYRKVSRAAEWRWLEPSVWPLSLLLQMVFHVRPVGWLQLSDTHLSFAIREDSTESSASSTKIPVAFNRFILLRLSEESRVSWLTTSIRVTWLKESQE